jgi:ubiquitin-activating enzyme E1
MNPDVQITAHDNRVGPETESIYNDDFFNSLTVAVNALDNIPSSMLSTYIYVGLLFSLGN